MRIKTEATRAKGEAALAYGQSQQEYKERVLAMLLGGTNVPGGEMAGLVGAQGAVGAGFIGSMADAFGTYAGGVMDQRENEARRRADAARRAAAMKTMPPVTPALPAIVSTLPSAAEVERRLPQEGLSWRGNYGNRKWWDRRRLLPPVG